MKSWGCGVPEVSQVPNRDSQQLVDKGLLVHHVGHIWHVETVKLWAVLKHNVSNLRY